MSLCSAGGGAYAPDLEGANQVFEAFVRAALEDKLGVVVQEQQTIGYLFRDPKRLRQLPDYLWFHGHRQWIGDAKWKLLSGAGEEDELISSARVSPADVRQLTTYAELFRRNTKRPFDSQQPAPVELAIFYPNLTEASDEVYQTWNQTQLHVVPLRVTGWHSPKDALP